MYRKKLLPSCIAVGMTPEEFWHSYPVEIEPYFEAQRIRRRVADEEAYFQGIYMMEAFSVVLGNAFRKKNTKPYKYREAPILKEIDEKTRPVSQKELEERAQREADRVFHRLEIARFNEELAQKRLGGG